MAATTITSYKTAIVGEWTEMIFTTASTADSANTIDMATYIPTGRTAVLWQAWDSTTGDSVTITVSGTTITLDASGGTTDHTYRILGRFI